MEKGVRLAGRIRAEQLRAVAATTDSTAIINAINATLICVAFWNSASHALLITWLVVNLLYSVAVRMDRDWERAATSRWPHRRLKARATFLGVLWGLVPWLVLPVEGPGHLLALGVVVAGMIAGGAIRLAVVPQAAFGFVWTMALIGASAFLAGPGPHSPVAAILIISLALFLSRHIRSYSQLQIRYLMDQIELSERNETISLLLNDFRDNSSDWLWETDRNGLIRDVSERFCEAAGRDRSRLQGSPISDLFAPESWQLEHHMCRRETFRDRQLRVSVDGADRYWVLTGRPVYDAQQVFRGYRGVAADVTEKVLATKRISYLAHHDSLTGLSNRVSLREQVERAVAAIETGGSGALFLIDLDEFKAINDTMGHPVGDELLASVAVRLKENFGGSEVVARLGGDEFAIFHHDRSDGWSPEDFAGDLLAVFEDPFMLAGAELAIKTSVGVALVGKDTVRSPDDLLRDADLALYRAKAEGGGFRVYEPEMNEWALRRHALRQELGQAIERDELDLAFQPIIDLASGRIVCQEALLRWSSATFGDVEPGEFIPIAEESGLMKSIGAWCLDRALRTALTWPEHIHVAVNLSPVQFRDERLTDGIAGMLADIGIDPQRVELEITESTFLDANRVTKATMRALKKLGASIVLDDFGTGYSSLSYLRDFPFDKIKIDRSFAGATRIDRPSRSIIRAVIDLGHALGMKVTAEGIQNGEQLAMLRALGCDHVQGFIYSRPVPAAEAQSLLLDETTIQPRDVDRESAGANRAA